MKHVRILNGRFASISLNGTTEWAREWIKSGQRGYICTVNVAILMMMRSDDRLRRFVEDAALVVADGQPLIWVSHAQGDALPERVSGVDLVDELCAMCVTEGWGIYFLGAKSDAIATVAERLAERHPGLKISGYADGYFGPDEAPARAEAVAASGAKVLLVGMGVPRQERFLEEQWDKLGVNVAVPVGGSFDVVAGIVPRAPEWMQSAGMEWFFRMAQEPRRLWRRYLTTNTQFIGLLGKEFGRKLAGRGSSSSEPDLDEDRTTRG